MKILIVGAGLAGLAAAWELSKLGHEIMVLEARDRVGGRTWSTQLSNGEITERGGEYIFPTEFPIRRLAVELEIPIISHHVRYGRRTLNGTHIDFATQQQTMKTAKATLETMMADGVARISVAQLFQEALGPGYRNDPVYRRLCTSLAADPTVVSAQASVLYESSAVGGYYEDGGRLAAGNQSLSIEVARRLGDVVRLEHPVTRIEQGDSGVRIELQDGSSATGDAAVIAVPLPVLRTLELGFSLPDQMQAALDHRLMGVAAKLGVPIVRTDEDPAVQDPHHTWWSWHSMSRDGETRIRALSTFAGGPDAVDALRVEDGASTWLAQLQELRPSTELDGTPLLTTWADDPWTRGAYSAAGLDWDERDADAFTDSAGRIAIAGEHTGLAQSLSGAVASGYRAAAAIQRQLES